LPLGDLKDDLAADGIVLGDILGCDFFLFTLALLVGFVVTDDFDAAVIGSGEDVPVVQEGIFWLTDVNKGGLESGLEVLDAAFKDRSYFAGIAGAFDFEFFKDSVL
jgi:hypothetical protein